MGRNQGDHLKWNEVKAGIVRFVISSDEAVPEPDIREFLRNEYKITDPGNIKKHLSDLQHRPYSCIEKIPPKQRGFANKWDIKNIENLRNIRSYFPEIQLTIYEKSLNIILKEHPHYANSLAEIGFRARLVQSPSFFDECLKTNAEILGIKAYEIYRFNKGFDKTRIIRKLFNEVYIECRNIILKDSNIWLIVCNEHIKDSFKSETNLNSQKFSSNIELLDEEFLELLEQTDIKVGEISGGELIERVMDDISLEISNQIYKQMLNEIPVESLKVKEMSEEVRNKIALEVIQKLYKEIDNDTFERISTITTLQNIFRITFLDIIFENCVVRDIIDGTCAPEEREFMNRIKDIDAYFNEKPEINIKSEYQVYNDLYIEYYEKGIKKLEIAKNSV